MAIANVDLRTKADKNEFVRQIVKEADREGHFDECSRFELAKKISMLTIERYEDKVLPNKLRRVK